MNAQIMNLVLVLVIIQVARKLDLENPDIITYVRIGYVSVQALILLLCYLTATKIKTQNDTTEIKYVEPAKPFTNEAPQVVETTFRDYDLGKIMELFKQTCTSVLFMLVLHLYFGFTQPLFIQSILPLKSLYQHPVVQIHLLGKKAEGELKRPFKNPSPFGLFDAQQPQTDKASIKKASKASKSKDD
ncbi:3592_t:CDS:2 [Acaulospora colombiana]|uniref:3592_t:CDS:1 n=1 Tax=Acaulospora colombiana TaxID=27376 RepID=A0ACA9KUF9_9GLOM|nr:3592_t:CDS:2 [Acaulospora colombiana]